MAIRTTIGRRIGTGFGLFIFFALVVVVLTNRTLGRSRATNDQITDIYAPSIETLSHLRNLVINSHTLIKHWALVESIPDAPEKAALVQLTDHDLPRVMDRIDTLEADWGKDEVGLMNRAFSDMDVLFALQDSVKNLLPTFESYKNPVVYFNAKDLAEEGGPLDKQSTKVLNDLQALLDVMEGNSRALRNSMIRNFDSLKFFILYLGSALVLVGAVLAFFIVRGITGPLRRVRGVLLALGRGVFPRTRLVASNDEIGDMSQALSSLIEGLRRTTDFSHAVAAGDFKADYQPMSEEDVLGHALLAMRSELAERERVLESKVKERTEEVVRQKEEVERQSRKVVELYKNVTDSIRYAKRLQESILPAEGRIRELLPEHFVLYRPKDIVSGDFYWVEQVDGKVVFATVDCTGHGVPGAFMSLVGYNGLNQVVKERGTTRPSEVLTELNRIAFEMLHKDRDQFMRDGMDMAFCCYDPAARVLEFAGANSPLYLAKGGQLLQFPPDKMPIGGFDLDGYRFTDHRISLEEGDVAYLFSDGYADQFGGPKGKKFLYRHFREVLLRISPEPMERQKAVLIDTLNDWRGAQEQVDDILVMGMRA